MTEKETRVPSHATCDTGCSAIAGASLTVSNAAGPDSELKEIYVAVLPRVPDAVTGLGFAPASVFEILPSSTS